MEDNLSFINWLSSFEGLIARLDTSDLIGTPPPAGAVKTGHYLAKEEERLLAFLKQEVGEAKKKWNHYLSLRPDDQKVQPFQELCLQIDRCKLIADSIHIIIKANLPAQFCQFVGVGFDDNMEIWVGPRIRRDIGDLPNPSTFYPPRF